MEELILKALPQIGTSGIAIAATVYLVKYLTDAHKVERALRDEAFGNFVEARNHQVTEILDKSIATNISSTNAIEKMSTVLERNTEALNSLKEKLK